MRQLHIFGSSHAARILQAALNNDNIRQNFSVTGTVRPGAKFNNLVFPSKLLNSFVESDVLLIQVFGNELLKRNVYVSHHNGKRLFTSLLLNQSRRGKSRGYTGASRNCWSL